MTLHDRIMSLKPIGHTSQVSAIHFNNAKMRAAKLAIEADELMAEMADALGNEFRHAAITYDRDALGRALSKYNAYKEQ